MNSLTPIHLLSPSRKSFLKKYALLKRLRKKSGGKPTVEIRKLARELLRMRTVTQKEKKYLKRVLSIKTGAAPRQRKYEYETYTNQDPLIVTGKGKGKGKMSTSSHFPSSSFGTGGYTHSSTGVSSSPVASTPVTSTPVTSTPVTSTPVTSTG